MRKFLRMIALVAAVLGAGAWVLLGANAGWTKTSVTRWQKDPVTELEGPVIEKRFVPGVDLLAGVCLGAAALFGISFLIPKTKIQN